MLRDRLRYYGQLIRWDKPIGTLLLLWPTLTALWIASDGRPRFVHVLVFTCGTWLMRSAGCAVNDVLDRHVDGHVKRTAQRVVASKKVSVPEALIVALVLTLLAAALLLVLNKAAFLWAWVALFLAATYPLLKRFFPMPQAYLALAFSFGIPMAFAAVLEHVPMLGWIFFLANLFWVVAYDTEYAMVDRDDDVKIGVRSSAVWLGRADVPVVMLCYGLMLGLMGQVGYLVAATWPFYVGLGVAAVCMGVHYRWIRTRERDACFRAFLHNQWVGLAIFIGAVAHFANSSPN